MGKGTFKMSVAISFSLFVLLFIVMSVTTFISIQLIRAGVVERGHMNPLWILAVASVVVGTGIGWWMSRLVIAPVVEISEAAKRIAQGDFGVTLKRHSRLREVQDLANNFSAMAHELSQTQMLRDDFVSNVSHEFKTPLATIEGYTVLLQSKTLSEERRARCVEKIIHNVKRLGAMTGNILILSRLDHGQALDGSAFFSLDEQIRQAILAFEGQWSRRKVDISVTLSEVMLFGNEELLAQVWQNLLGNALKFVEDGGRIGVVLRCEEGRAIVRVSDNGCGMPEEVLPRVFERFYQGESSHAGEGNGLGLSLVKRIVELHGGSVGVRSEPGEGSEFTVELPQAVLTVGA